MINSRKFSDVERTSDSNWRADEPCDIYLRPKDKNLLPHYLLTLLLIIMTIPKSLFPDIASPFMIYTSTF